MNNKKWPWKVNVKNSNQDVSKYPKISIITSSFNQGQYIEETIRSVVYQNYPNFEYIIIDGGSTDNTIEIINKYSIYISYWVSEPDFGCANALNKGLEKATGEFFYYLNSDDYLLENALSIFYNHLCKYPSYNVYYGNGLILDERNNLSYKFYSGFWSLQNYLNGLAPIAQQATFLDLNFIKKQNLKFNEQNKTCWDGELLVDFALQDASFSRMSFKSVIGVFRLHGTSITGSGTNYETYSNDLNRISKKIISFKPNLLVQNGMFYKVKNILGDPLMYVHRLCAKAFKAKLIN